MARSLVILAEPILFQWDEGNRDKSLIKHGVGVNECEEAFLDPHKLTAPDLLHSASEERYMLTGTPNLIQLF